MLRLSGSVLRALQRQNLRTASTKASSIEQQQDAAQTTTATGSATPGSLHEAQLSKREPLVKNFFIGVVDKELLGYPEVITREDMANLQNSLLPIKNYFAEPLPADASVYDNLKQLGLYGLNASTDYEGKGYAWSASLIASEPESAQTGLALGLHEHRVVLDMLRETGTVEQQQRYVPALASGELIASQAMHEYTPPETEYFHTRAQYDAESNKWTLNGEKAFVACAPAGPGTRQLFLLLAQTQQSNVPSSIGISTTVFLVDSTHPGVRLGEQHPTFGCQELPMRRLHLDNVQLTQEAVLGLPHDGNRMAELLLRATRLRSSLLGITLSKQLLNQLTAYSVDNAQCGRQLNELELMRVKLSQAMCSTYAMESMLYLTAGLLDEFKGQDVTLESAITKYYTTNRLFDIARQHLNVLGPKCLHNGQPSEQRFRDAVQLYTQGESQDTLSMFIALLGLQHAGQKTCEGVKKSRNPLFHPGHIFAKYMQTSSIESPKTKMLLGDNLHPTLEPAAQCIEHSVARLEMAVELMLTRHGQAVVERQHELKRLAEMSACIYAMFASAARASRSYCIGLPLADHEMLTATTVCWEGQDRVKELCLEIFHGNYRNNDNNWLRLSKQLSKSRGYFAAHPLTFNF